MDSRRTLTRGRPRDQKEVKKSEVKRNSLRTSSPNRRSSPVKKSSPPPTRKSPARRSSPARKASPPSRPASTTSRRSSRQRSAAVITPIPVAIPPSPIKEASPLPKVLLGKINTSSYLENEKLTSTVITSTGTTTSSVHSSFSISTNKTVDIGSKNNSGDSEIAKLTNFIRRSVSKTFSNSQREGSHTPSTHLSQASRSVSRSVYDDGDNHSKIEFSDSEEDNFKSINVTTKSSYTPLFNKSTSVCRKLEVPREFGGLIGASILLLLVPFVAYYLPWSCKRVACEFKVPNMTALLDLKYMERVFNGKAVGSYVAFVSGIFVLSTVLFGRFVRLPSERIGSGYYFNALPIAVLATIGFVVGEYLSYPVAEYISKNYLRYCLYSLFNAFLAAFWCYARSNFYATQDLQTNPYGKSGNFIVDFALGRHVNPKWFGKVDIKQVYYKTSLIFTLLLAEIYIYKNIHIPVLPEKLEETQTWVGRLMVLGKFYAENIELDLVSLTASILLLTYVLDAIIFEHHLASSFELQQEGVGALLLLRYAAAPFLLNAVPKFLFEHKPVLLPNWALSAMVVLFLAGLILKRMSNRIKYKYRINPGSREFASLETVHTFQGRRLLLGSLWGRVRQPNYAGEILALLSFTIPSFYKFRWPPLVSILLLVVFLLHRAVRANTRNSTRYHSSWVRYCTKVKHMVVPRVF